MWIAEGFIVQEANKRRIEDIGSKYFDDLLNMSIFIFEGGKYKMHTLIHELAQSVSGNKCFRMENKDGNLATGVRHLSIFCRNIQIRTFESFYECKGLRTLILLQDYGASITAVPHHLFTKLNRLRVLDLSGSHVTVLTDALGNLMHLRYFDLSKTHIEWLPETISKLYKLQSLNLKDCRCLPQLPKSTSKLISLRHIELEGSRLTSMPIGFGKLTNLQTLREFIVGSGVGDARISELREIQNLRGVLRIKKLENIRKEDISETMLDNKAFLHKLELQWSEMQDEGIHTKVLESLQPNENLQELTIRKYSGREFPNWAGNTFLPCLVSLRLLECRNCNVLPSFGHLPKLKSLELAEILMVTSIDSMFCADDQPSFPSLETLVLLDMPKLSTWRRLSNNDLPSLTKLLIDTCPQLTDLPTLHHLKSLHELEFRYCYGLSKLPEEGLSKDLHSLIIMDCPLLLEQCREGGKFWKMIENISYKEIN
ncbi:hypothetical protein Sjap_012196 [Stephania japonica]|uniref:Uncharacterized protein n=1 Tax=Stephania japonica TaxID=461633 RepID=A0AAP0IVL7_9MAGN